MVEVEEARIAWGVASGQIGEHRALAVDGFKRVLLDEACPSSASASEEEIRTRFAAAFA